MNQIKTLNDIGDIFGKKIIVRGNLNVPVENGQIVDPERIEATLQTVHELKERGAKIILIGHIGRDKKETLEPIKRYLQHFMPVIFVQDIYKKEEVLKTLEQTAEGSVILFENLRKWDGETKNEEEFAKLLASYGDIYVNEDFSSCHREHASMVLLPKLLPSFIGRQLEKEIQNLSKFFEPEHPFLFILGGAKVETKLPLLEEFSKKADTLFVGGILANDFFKLQGLEIGQSKTSDIIPPKDLLDNKSIIFPEDLVVSRDNKKVILKKDSVGKEDFIYDAGPKSIEKLIKEIKKAKFVLWNGPLGYCEENFCDGTIAVATALSQSNVFCVIGGGDTLAAVPQNIQEKITFISTGGGAMLEFLAKKSLPAIEALK